MLSADKHLASSYLKKKKNSSRLTLLEYRNDGSKIFNNSSRARSHFLDD